MKSIPNAIMRMRAFVLISTVALTIIFGYGLTKLTINSDIRGTDGGLEIGKLIPPGDTLRDGTPQNPESFGGLREYVLDKDIYRGKVVSEDGSASVILSRINPRYNRIEVAKMVRA